MKYSKISASLLVILVTLEIAFASDFLRVRRDENQQQLINGRRGKVRKVKKLRQQPLGAAGNPSVQIRQFPVARAPATTPPGFNRQPKAIGFPAPQQQQQRQQVPVARPVIQQQSPQIQPVVQQQQLRAAPAVTPFVPNALPTAEVKRPQPSFSSSQQQQQPQLPPVPIHNQDFKIDDFGNYQFNFETGDQVQRVESGQQVIRNDEKFQAIEGSYSYTGPDGKLYTVRYIADENGFQPIGDHIPRLPKVSRKNKQ